MGKNMKHALNFAKKYPGWHTFAKDRATVNAVHNLQRKGLIEINSFNQFRASKHPEE